MQDKIKPKLLGQPSTWISSMFSAFHRFGLMGRWGAYIVLLMSLLITISAWYFARAETTKRDHARFNFRVESIEKGIYERLQAYEFLLQGGSGLFSTTNEVTRDDWRTYITRLLVNQYYPGIQGVGFSKRILPSDKDAHIRQIRSEGFPKYTINPVGDRPEYTSIIFLEPFDWRNQRAFGYDMFSEPIRKEAMIRARDTGKAALSGKVTLVQETDKDKQAGFLIYQAIYRKGEPNDTPEQKHKALMGYVYSPFRMNEFMKGILAEKESYIELQIFDGDKPLQEMQLYNSDKEEEPFNYAEGSHFATDQVVLEYASHRWLLSFVSSKHFEKDISTGSSNFILWLGITISLLLFGMLLSLAKSYSQAINLANTTVDLKKANIELRKEIMERKQAEINLIAAKEKAEESEKKFSDILDNTKLHLWAFDGTQYIYVNKNWYDYTGQVLNTQLTVELWVSTVHPDDNERSGKIWMENWETKTEHDNYFRLKRHDGVYRDFFCHAVPVFDKENNFKYFQGFNIDITERKQAEESLQESEQKYQTMMESMKEPIYICSQDFIVEYMNPAMLKRTGHDATGESCFKAIHDLDERCPWCHYEDVMAGNTYELDVVSPKDNHSFHILVTPVVNNDGSISSLNVFRDVTKFKKMEAQVQQSQKMESIGTLAGGIAHDFNNILFPIVGHTEMLIADIPGDSPFQPGLKQIYTGAMRASELVKQILTFSRQESGELKLMKMQPLIKEALKLISSTIPTTIKIKQNIQADCGAIKADPTQIHQIVMNLATNAYHAMEETGGELKVGLKQMELGTHDLINPDMTPGQYACLTVADTGTGMDKKLTQKIFDPFFTTKAVGKGTGMGLSVVHGIVAGMGGTVRVYSEPGKGTQFYIYFPIEKGSFVKHSVQAHETIQGGIERVLLVDDEDAIITMEKLMLERLGYQVTSRTSSIEALEAFRAAPDKFNLVITDMAMPNMPGDKLSAELNKIRSDIPVLLCTGFIETMSEEKASSLGIKGFLLKPIVMKDLAQKIREVLDENKI